MAARVLVVDDSAVAREQLSGLVTDELGAVVVATADHGVQAVDLAGALRPDLITLDVQMPVMNGLVALKHIMARRPTPVVMVSAFTGEDSHVTFDCLRCGALDFVPKPGRSSGMDPEQIRQLIVERLARAADPAAPSGWFCRMQRPRKQWSITAAGRLSELVVVVGGRGAVAPLLKILNSFPSSSTAAALVVLDLPLPVVESLAVYLNRFSVPAVQVVGGHTELRPGHAYLVPQARSCVLAADGPRVYASPVEAPPGATWQAFSLAMLVSAAEILGAGATVVFLSGAPCGVVAALEALRAGGGASLVQAPETALEGAGPRAAAAFPGAHSVVVRPDDLATAIAARVGGGR